MEYKIIQIISDIMEANCYLINYDNKTVIVDPCVNVSTLKRYNVREVTGVLITHCHVDHIFYLEEIIKEYNPTVYLSNCGIKMICDDNMNLSNYFIKPLNIKKDSFNYVLLNNEEFFIDALKIKCINTPGHTKDSVCFLIDNDLFTGDTLFDRSIGRTDFPTGDSLKMRESLRKILEYNKDFTIYPGHNDVSTINEQINKNYYLKFWKEK